MRQPGNLPLDSKSLRYLRIGSFIFLAIHFLVLERYGPVSFGFIVLLGLIKAGCCLWWFFLLSSSLPRFRWLFNAISLIFDSSSLAIYLVSVLFLGKFELLPHVATLAESLAFVPMLFAVASNFSRKDPPAVRWIDAALCLPLACLYFTQTYWLTSSGSHAIFSILLMNNIRFAFLLACAALQFIASENEEDRRFLYVFFVGLAVNMPLLALRNHYAPFMTTYILDILVDLPLLITIFLALHPMPAWVRRFRPRKALAHFVRGGNPILMSLALTLLSIAISRQHFLLGAAGILIGILGYGLRNAVIHSKLLKTEETLLQTQDDLEVMATHDALTGIPNRRSFDTTLEQAWRHAARMGEVLAVLMIDIDFFKALNDTYGHQTGDDCLAGVAREIKSMLPRKVDYVSRYGGEEFAVILPETTADGALQVAERLRSGILALAIPHASSQYEYVTVSIGAAAGSATDTTNACSLLKAADEALYRAKSSGRNQTESVDRSSVVSL